MRPVLIVGPTASGKSALALALAERDGGTVINADALQVYACWRVLTARPDAAALARAPHALYGHVACDAPYSAGAWLAEAARAIDAARMLGRRPIVVGGTGLYVEALTRGLAAIPVIPAEVRERAAALPPAALAADLARDDPATLARLDRRNPRRLQRAWEVLRATGRGLEAWRAAPRAPTLPLAGATAVIVDCDILSLNNNIKARFNAMLEDGALAEVAAFRAAGGRFDRPSGKALGAAELAACLDGHVTLAEARAAAVAATRRYAKRQRTWFRHRMADWPRIDPASSNALDRLPRIG
jgi:tRNA dimethylallyltransferase